MRLKSNDLIQTMHAVDVSFKLYRCKDKELRRTLRAFMIGEIKRLNKKQKSLKVNSVSFYLLIY